MTIASDAPPSVPTYAPGQPHWFRTAGGTGLTTSALGLGGGPLSSMPEVLGYEVPPERAIDLVNAVLHSPIAVIDTSNGYGNGDGERRIGEALRISSMDAKPLVITKVDPKDGDYSGDRVRRSVEESSARLGMDFFPLVHLHDPEFFDFDDLTAPGGAVEALVELKASGVIGAIGVAGGHTPTMKKYVDLGVFDALLVHNRLTLVDRSAEELFSESKARGMAIFNAAIFGGGILASPASSRKTYAYKPASPSLLSTIAAMDDLCKEFGTDLAAAAVQASLREPLVDCTLLGMSRPSRVEWALNAASTSLPDDFWDRISRLLPPSDQWIDAIG